MRVSRLQYELEKHEHRFTQIIGCDEVGRGCLAGPVVAAAVTFNPYDLLTKKLSWIREIKDSKLLTPAKREELALHIKQHALGWGIGSASPKIIDKINIHHASLSAMKQAVAQLRTMLPQSSNKNKLICVDGKFIIPGISEEQEAIVDGDAKIFTISAASILAKVYRDDLMSKVHRKFPLYNLAQHKGYATAEHRSAIKQHGLSPIHRVSFCGNILCP